MSTLWDKQATGRTVALLERAINSGREEAACCVHCILQDKQTARKRQKLQHVLRDGQQLLLAGPGSVSTEEYGSSGQAPMTLAMRPFQPTTSLYFHPEQQPLSLPEAAEMARRPPKTLNIKGTRLPHQQLPENRAEGSEDKEVARAVGLAAPASQGAKPFRSQPPALCIA